MLELRDANCEPISELVRERKPRIFEAEGLNPRDKVLVLISGLIMWTVFMDFHGFF